jgi:hypothetical protein
MNKKYFLAVMVAVWWFASRGMAADSTNEVMKADALPLAETRGLAGTNGVSGSALELTRGWKEMSFKFEVQHPYDLDLKERYTFDATNNTHDFWVFFADKPHDPPPNRTTARTEMRLETFTNEEHMFDADVNIRPGTFACIGQVFDAVHGPIQMIIAHPDGTVTLGRTTIKTNAIGQWWNLKMKNDPAPGGKIRIYADNVLVGTYASRGPRAYYFKCGVYSRKNSARSEAWFRNIKMWVKPGA